MSLGPAEQIEACKLVLSKDTTNGKARGVVLRVMKEARTKQLQAECAVKIDATSEDLG